MRIQLGVRHEDGVAREVLVDAPGGTTAAQLTRALGGSLRHGELLVERRPVAPHVLLGCEPLLHGAVLTIAGRAERRRGTEVVETTGPSPWLLRVEAGPDVGLLLPLSRGPLIVGRAVDCPLRLTDPGVSRRHVELTVEAGAVTARDLSGTNGTWVDGRPLGPVSTPVPAGTVLRLGSTTMTLEPGRRESRRLTGDGEGHLLLDPRAGHEPRQQEPIVFPDPPPEPERSRFPLVALVVPVVVAGALAAVMHSPAMLLFGLSGPMLSAVTWASTRTGRRRRRRDEAEAARRQHAQASVRLRAALAAERQALESAHPPPADLLGLVEARSPTLWSAEGMPGSAAAVSVRLGRGARPASTPTHGATAPAAETFDDVPVSVDLTTCRQLHVQGGRTASVAAVTNLLTRMAAQHPPSRVEIQVVVGSAVRAADWSFARLLPHTTSVTLREPSPGPTPEGTEGAGREGRANGRVPSTGERDPPTVPLLVVVHDGRAAHRPAPCHPERRGVDGRPVCVVVLDEQPTDLELQRAPAPGVAVLRLDGSRARLVLDEAQQTLRPDQPGPAYAWRMARALAPLRERGEARDATSSMPSRMRLPLPGPDELADRWAVRPRSTMFRLGVGGTGPVDVDLAAEGPHALVAGTTGSGKSELLQTLVCSLALVNRPDELTFVLVDYKGGAAFRGCAALPHVVGWVTDLDAHLTRRALTSLGAEIRRRERLLAAAGVKDLDDYHRHRDSAEQGSRPRLPRLVIVVDEFRVLAEELPDFVHGLVRLAAVGRSLGIHLVLATQRPGGVVTADMRANLSLRVALRVRDRMDSLDVLEDPAAAEIPASTPGRAFLRGAATGLTALQTALVTGRPEGPGLVRLTDVTRWWDPAPLAGTSARDTARGSGAAQQGDAAAPRDIDAIVDMTRRAARALGIAPAAAPWLPPLPDTLDIARVTGRPDTLPLGLEDRPDEQRQQAWSWPLDGHLGIAGGPTSGRTTCVLTVAGALAARFPPDACHLYVLGPDPLASLGALPHTAVVAGLHDPEHVALVVDRLASIVRERLAGAPPTRPLVVVLVDGWEQLATLDAGASAATLRALLDSGRGLGVLAAVTGGRALLSGPLTSALQYRLALRLPDPVELTLAGIPTRSVPLHQPPGRALDVAGHREVQLGTLGGAATRTAQEEVLAGLATRWEPRGGGPRPVLALPQRLRRAGCAWPPDHRTTEEDAALLLLGVRAGDRHPVGFRSRRGGRRVVVVGPPSSGRTTALATLVQGLQAAGRHVAVVGPDLAQLVGHPPEGGEPRVQTMTGAADDLGRLMALRRRHADLAVVVDDAEDRPDLGPVLQEIARLADEDDGFVGAGTAPEVLERRGSALIDDLARAETGLLLHPRPGMRVLGVTVGPSDARTAGPPGRGLLVSGRVVERVQVALPQRPDGS